MLIGQEEAAGAVRREKPLRIFHSSAGAYHAVNDCNDAPDTTGYR